MEDGDREIQLVARGATISRAVDVAEVCRRRNGHIAQGLPASVNIQHLSCESEEVEGENGMRTVSVLRIDMEGVGDVPERQILERSTIQAFAEFPQPSFVHFIRLADRVFELPIWSI